MISIHPLNVAYKQNTGVYHMLFQENELSETFKSWGLSILNIISKYHKHQHIVKLIGKFCLIFYVYEDHKQLLISGPKGQNTY